MIGFKPSSQYWDEFRLNPIRSEPALQGLKRIIGPEEFTRMRKAGMSAKEIRELLGGSK